MGRFELTHGLWYRIWLGFIDHTNEHSVGTKMGTIKGRAIRRKDSTEQFSMIQIEEITGTPWQPVPGKESLRIPTNIEYDGTIVNEEGEQ